MMYSYRKHDAATRHLFTAAFFYLIVSCAGAQVWVPDLGDGRYQNPIIHADYSDPDVVRVGTDFYMTSSSFNCAPGLPILHSKDLVNWTIVNHVFTHQQPAEAFSKPQHGNGVWAPSIRYHRGWYYIFYGDPDFGIYMTKTRDPRGEWTTPHLVQAAKGWIDPCPLWDEDGKAYLVHAFAGSRSGIKSVIVVHRMKPDGTALLDDGVLVFDGHEKHPTIEGPKFYKRGEYYYIFAPGGGVPTGWQTVLRSKNVFGPYEDKIVLHQGNTDINGPHQGGWVSLSSGEDWFIHFQDKEAYGRIVHLQPVRWENGWPLMGVDQNRDGIGEPVLTFRKPNVGRTYPVAVPQTSDEFNDTELGSQWQWHANPEPVWAKPSPYGFLRLYSVPAGKDDRNLWEAPNLLLQKFPAPAFRVATKLKFYPKLDGDRAGLIVMGMDYAHISLVRKEGKLLLTQAVCRDARGGKPEQVKRETPIDQEEIYLAVTVKEGGICTFSYSLDGINYEEAGATFTAVEGRWIGAKVGVYCQRTGVINDSAYADFDWFRVGN